MSPSQNLPTETPKQPTSRTGLLIAGALFVLVLGIIIGVAAGSGSDNDQTAISAQGVADLSSSTAPAKELTPVTEPTTTQPPTSTTPSTTAAPPTAAPVTEPPTATAPAPPPEAVKVPMPSVVCMNLQEAQDTIQRAGVFLSLSFDATGAGRMQINDSNWVVVSQDPAPGTLIGEGDANLGAVKYGESSSC